MKGTYSLTAVVFSLYAWASSWGQLSSLQASPQTTIAPAATATAAARILDQATFGPTSSDISHVQTVGLPAYLQEQISLSPTYLPSFSPLPSGCPSIGDCLNQAWWQNVLSAGDQLRQRVAFALSEIWVTSTQVIGSDPMAAYYNILLQNSFGNWRDLMKAVTLSPAMGTYLNMVNSGTASNGQIVNENYAREMMQLFSLGPNLLNDDGTVQLDGNGNPIPTYSESQVQAFARVYTGWTWAQNDGTAPPHFPAWTYNWNAPMASNNAGHDLGAKTLLNGTTLPAGQSAAQDLDQALDNIFAHPNLPPFICKQLIQHLVTSTPNPGYVARVANVFKNNGKGVRGDMSAVIQAVLLDPEARVADTNLSYQGGHLREPLLFMTDVMRALNYSPVAVPNGSPNGYQTLLWYSQPLGQNVFQAPSVFSFYAPGYVVPGTQLNAPEFGLENTSTAAFRITLGDWMAGNHINGFSYDASATGWLGAKASNLDQLVSTLDALFMHSQMPALMHSTIVGALGSISDLSQRVRVAVFLVITSSQYKVIH